MSIVIVYIIFIIIYFMRNRILSKDDDNVKEYFSPQKRKQENSIQVWQGYMSIALNSTEAGVRQFLS